MRVYVQPMLCGRATCVVDAAAKVGAGPCLVETKLDGERIQIHIHAVLRFCLHFSVC